MMAAIEALKQALEHDKEFQLVQIDSNGALVRLINADEERYLVNVDELEEWRKRWKRWNEKFVSQEDDIVWLE